MSSTIASYVGISDVCERSSLRRCNSADQIECRRLRGRATRPEQRQTAVSESVTASQLLLSKEQAITLRRCDDEPALEYGCVDWFLYDKQRSQ